MYYISKKLFIFNLLVVFLFQKFQNVEPSGHRSFQRFHSRNAWSRQPLFFIPHCNPRVCPSVIPDLQSFRTAWPHRGNYLVPPSPFFFHQFYPMPLLLPLSFFPDPFPLSHSPSFHRPHLFGSTFQISSVYDPLYSLPPGVLRTAGSNLLPAVWWVIKYLIIHI